ncbi:MAG TPA: tetraacyldisaccharide 4'-kinase [Tahibacter sp.]|uniref:tetraacyldisaccharide 4'-kinase n=1 Tax=Tahibacter sp. TaxID=2056211 RepID=UPI002B796F06|nr:tetraacyldisaccharide 4'-kinase [Tahibacter sp.]HSX62204.1 tetraacyldisaccharide 4'-kinase [Tahibacter sp.]
MNAAARRERVWYHGAEVPISWGVLARLYGGVTALRRRAYARGWLRRHPVGKPVVVVGNISVGGTGKTPLTIALVRALAARGLRAGVVSRGYGGSAKGPLLLDADATPAQVGDEPLLIRDLGGAPVVVGRDRVAAARLLIASADIDVVLADDGLQHYRLHRDVEICVIDGARRFGNRRLLPAGPLREPLSRLEHVDFRVCNGGLAHADEVQLHLRDDGALNLVDGRHVALDAFAHRRVHAVAGIGHPRRFFDSLRAARIDAIEHAFADHHLFGPADLAFGDGLPVLMTGKDAVKCRAFAQPDWWQVAVQAQLPERFLDSVAARIRAAALESAALEN